MATATQILDRASQVTGLRTSSTERTLAFQAVQNAYYRALMDTECVVSSAQTTLTAGTGSYAVSALIGTATATATAVAGEPYVLKLREAILVQSGGTTRLKLKGISEGELLEKDTGTILTGIPRFYAVVGTRTLRLWPPPSGGDVLELHYVPFPKSLVESSASPGTHEEVSPTMVPTQFHWDVLFAGTVLEMLDKDQRAKDVQFWQQRYMDGIARMKQWSASFMGDANPAWVAGGGSIFRWEDQGGR